MKSQNLHNTRLEIIQVHVHLKVGISLLQQMAFFAYILGKLHVWVFIAYLLGDLHWIVTSLLLFIIPHKVLRISSLVYNRVT